MFKKCFEVHYCYHVAHVRFVVQTVQLTVTSAATVKCVFMGELGAMVTVIVPTEAMKSQDATPVRI